MEYSIAIKRSFSERKSGEAPSRGASLLIAVMRGSSQRLEAQHPLEFLKMPFPSCPTRTLKEKELR